MGKTTEQDVEKIMNTADAILDIFDGGKFSYPEIRTTLSICWALIILDMQQLIPEAAKLEKKMVSDIGKLIQFNIDDMRKKIPAYAKGGGNEQETSIDKPTINPN